MSERPPYETKFPGLNAPNIVPQASAIRERWTPTMAKWGTSMKDAYVSNFLSASIFVESLISESSLPQCSSFGPNVSCRTRAVQRRIYGCWSIRVCPFILFNLYSSLNSHISPHILAPTASDLNLYGKKDTILAGFHTDLNFLTIHGRSRYPGLHIWARNSGKRIPVKLPPTGPYLLVQAGKQLEHLSGGLIKAGYHEVVVNDATIQVSDVRSLRYLFGL